MVFTKITRSIFVVALAFAFATDAGWAQPAAPAAGAATAPNPADNPVIVIINGQKITKSIYASFLSERISKQINMMARQGMPVTPETVEAMHREIAATAPEQLIDQTLFKQALDKEMPKISDEAVDKELVTLRAMYKKSGMDLDEEIKKSGRTQDSIEGQLRQQLASFAVVRDQVGSLEPTAEEMKKFHAQHSETPEEIETQHILIGFSTDAGNPHAAPPSAEEKAACKKKADEALARIKGGEDFAKVAQEVSTDKASAASGGKLGYSARGQAPKEFEEAAWKLKVDEVSPVVETPYGYQVIKVTGHKNPEKIKYDDAKDEIRQILMQQNFVKNAQKAVDKIRAASKIEKTDAFARVVKVPAGLAKPDSPAAQAPAAPPAENAETK
ncbi:MAG: peptidylprolyl isomerase [bacterium]|nr:peptidylprolyl isomerase [bacterium]